VNKDAREHFEIRTHQRIFDLYKPSAKIVTSLTKLDLPAGIDVEIKI
jgi:small subunit ribosomal protein S10